LLDELLAIKLDDEIINFNQPAELLCYLN